MPAATEKESGKFLAQLDALDRKLLYELDLNSRQSFSDLARKVRQGRDRVEYRVERLVKEKVIRGFTTSVNLYRLGLTIYKTYLRLRNNRERMVDFLTYLKRQPNVYRLALYDGGWDINIVMVARTPRDHYDSHVKLLSQFHDIVLDYGMYTIIDVHWFPKGYFVNKAGSPALTGGKPENYQIDQLEYDILKAIAVQSRTSVVNLAEKLNSTPAIIKYRIEKLEEEGIIVRYRLNIDHSRLGMLYFKTQLFLADYQQKHIKKFYDFCFNEPRITCFIEQLGECSVEIELEVDTLEQYHDIIDRIREEFPTLIQNFRSMLISDEYFKWVPQDLTLSE